MLCSCPTDPQEHVRCNLCPRQQMPTPIFHLEKKKCTRFSENWVLLKPICSMYGIFTNICPKNHQNVGKYTIHGAYGKGSRAIKKTSPIRRSDDWFLRDLRFAWRPMAFKVYGVDTQISMDWIKGKFTGKPLSLMGKSMVSCKFSLKPIHWKSDSSDRKFGWIDIGSSGTGVLPIMGTLWTNWGFEHGNFWQNGATHLNPYLGTV